MRIGSLAIGLFAAILAAGCDVGGAPADVVADCSQQMELPPSVTTDILFVIDDSDSMREEQEKVARELEAFVRALAEGPVQNDFRIAVTTTGTTANVRLGCNEGAPTEKRSYENGELQPATLPDDEGEGPRILSYRDPDLLERFATLVRRGTEGSGQEMGLEAMRLALSDSDNGFLRPGARLLVVIVSDEDDCSDPGGSAVALGACETNPGCTSDDACEVEGAYCIPVPRTDRRACLVNACETPEGRAALEPVATYVEFLRNLDDGTGRGRKRETYLAVIGAVDEETEAPARCISSSDEAYGVAVRYVEAVEAMGERGTLASICAEDYGAALAEIAELVRAPHVLELDPAPPDGRLVVVEIERADGTRRRCRSGDGFSFEPATRGAPARLTLEGDCRLQHGDRIDVKLVCAG